MTSNRPALAELGLSAGKRARLHRILFDHGPRNGTAMFLPYDQGLEHGPRDFFANPAARDPRYIIGLALEGGFNGIVAADRPGREVLLGVRRRGAARPQAQRQDRDPLGR